MADFRKWFLVLAVVALVALPAGAQVCSTNPGNPTSIRDGGLTELVGDLVLSCTPSTTTYTTNVQIFLQGATVTNRVRAGATLPNGSAMCPVFSNCVTDSMMLVDENTSFTTGVPPIIGLLQPAVAGTDSPTNRTSVLFPNFTVVAGSTFTLRITNVRVAAPALSTVGLGLPTQVIESVGILNATVSPSFQVVANVLPALQFAVTNCGNYRGRQCVSESANSIKFVAKFTEGFGLAFKSRGTTGQIAPGLSAFTNYFESGLTLVPTGTTIGPIFNGAYTSYADSGTILRLNFKNIPAGVNISVTTNQLPTSSTTIAAIPAAGSASSSGSAVMPNTSNCSGTGSNAVMPIIRNADGISGFAIWEVTRVGTPEANVQAQIQFGIVVSYTSNTSAQLPALTGANPSLMSGQLAPISTVAQADTSAPIPRFRNNEINSGNFSVLPCATTLLYPFVTNKAGFETGIAVINASLDNYNSTSAPFVTATQTGPCTIYFFDGTTSAPAPVDTGTIVPGGQYVNTVSGLANGAAFQGYLIAKCNFQYGHGYAYVTDTSSTKLGAQGYLALVIPDIGSTSRNPDPFSAAGSGSGEQLAN